mmetsp:Transcript_32496/g.71509  ORF Transcript_32496/g.71509 Transcript_32496/m.71509 type:complete len:222 (-) Transcript_32496:333-998(-)
MCQGDESPEVHDELLPAAAVEANPHQLKRLLIRAGAHLLRSCPLIVAVCRSGDHFHDPTLAGELRPIEVHLAAGQEGGRSQGNDQVQVEVGVQASSGEGLERQEELGLRGHAEEQVEALGPRCVDREELASGLLQRAGNQILQEARSRHAVLVQKGIVAHAQVGCGNGHEEVGLKRSYPARSGLEQLLDRIPRVQPTHAIPHKTDALQVGLQGLQGLYLLR